MKKIITENEVVATFLKAEINSPRWKGFILEALTAYGKDRSIIDRPDVYNEDQNILRANILGLYRGYKRNKYLFYNFPIDMQWERIELGHRDLQRIRYLKQCRPWFEFSGGTLLVSDAAQRIQEGIGLSEETKEVLSGVLQAVEALKRGESFLEIILVAQSPVNQLVALEGHLRLTALSLLPSSFPILAIVGYSKNLVKWEELW